MKATGTGGGAQRVTYRQAQALVETAFSVAAKRNGVDRDDLEDLGVPACVPDSDLAATLSAQRDRLERLLAMRRTWSFGAWRERLLDHPLVGSLARRLIWQVGDGQAAILCGWSAVDQTLVDVDDRRLMSVSTDASVRLWHPIDSHADVVLAWRTWLERHAVRQPFKQAHREVYLLTDVERHTEIYSNRFAAHILRQHQLKALCDQRGWRMRLQGGFDPGDSNPRLTLPRAGIWAEFWVYGVLIEQERSGMGIALYVSTDQVRIGRLNDDQPMRLEDVPPLVFSEVMRDVDLFIGVCSVGNDPAWHDTGPQRFGEYWQTYAFGQLTQSGRTRRDVLQRILPKLTQLQGKWSLEDRFLVVRGALRTYKIHLVSGNILMAPNDAYLCIVPNRGASQAKATGSELYLPFEGDAMLSIILSKALMLASDTSIKDQTIMRQINLR